MKRAPYTFGTDQTGKQYWRSLDELAETPEFKAAVEREFPDGAAELIDPVSRRSFLNLMGSSAALAGLAACRRPEEKILPYAHQPESMIPGNPDHYATVVPFLGTAVGLIVESHAGRPTKIEGNPLHPESLGAANIYIQASVLDMYDVDRSTSPQEAGKPSTWAKALETLTARGAALKGKQGAGLAILTEAHRSPTLQKALNDLTAQLPGAKVYRYEPHHRDSVREGARLAFGKVLDPVLALDKASVVVSLDSDFLQTEYSPLKNARGFAARRKLAKPGDTLSRLYSAESRYSITGANADHRLRIKSSEVGAFAFALARQLATAHGVALPADVVSALDGFKGTQFETKKKWVAAVAKDLANAKDGALLVAGWNQPASVHAVVNLINQALGAVGTTVSFVKPFDESAEGPASLAALTESITKKEVDTLVILGGNPVFSAPADVGFAAALQSVPFSAHLSLFHDETCSKVTWHLNRTHFLEEWSDARSEDGTAAIVQPLIAPLFAGRTDAEVVRALLGDTRKAYELVRATWAEGQGLAAENVWRKALHQGVIAGTTSVAEVVAVAAPDLAKAISGLPKSDGFEVTFAPDSHALDGRFANNGWLQEMPDPMSKITWDNAAQISPSTATKLGVRDGDLLSIKTQKGGTVKVAVAVQPGQADESVALTFGQGRSVVGRVGVGVGFDTYPLRSSAEHGIATGAQVQKVEGRHQLARTQEHHVMEGRPIVLETDLKGFTAQPDFAQKRAPNPPASLTVLPDWKYEGHKWGMVIDLNSCIGCNACMVACQSENNIPLVGREGVIRSREMHWIRVDRYYADMADDPATVFQPLPCMQCENAPCETVCPVAATTHSPEGLNDMAYNRCVGTRYCANNCPYKVRRFNYFNYAKDFSAIKKGAQIGTFFKEDLPEIRKMQFNPDVTVRSRGVMEKCTYCTQRITEVKLANKRDGKPGIKDGEIRTACQQTCPTEAIHFGDLNDPKSDVSIHAQQPRDYSLLAELNTRPRTTYLAKVRNPNAELETA